MTKRILIVDNEQYIQEVAKACLETVAGWEVLLADSGQDCLRQAAAEQPDAILLDVMMPDMDGIMTFEQLQETPVTQSIPVILLTAKIQPSDRQHYARIGIRATITKPFEPLKLAGQVASTLGWDAET
jgi:CheY-like chemotaxis protein